MQPNACNITIRIVATTIVGWLILMATANFSHIAMVDITSFFVHKIIASYTALPLQLLSCHGILWELSYLPYVEKLGKFGE